MFLPLTLTALASLGGGYFPEEPVPAALARAAAAEQPLVVFYHARWSPTSRALAEEIPGLVQWLGERSKGVLVDLTTQPELADAYSITGVPTLVVLGPGGEEKGRVRGFDNLEEVGAQLAAIFRDRARIVPPPEPVREKDPMLRLHKEGEQRAAYGQSEAALEAYVRCWEEGAEGSYLSYRLEALPHAMALLGRSYAPARAKMLELREPLEASLRKGEGDWRVARDLVTLDKALGDSAHALAVYDAVLAAKAPARVRETLFDVALVELAAAGRHGDILGGAPKVQFRLKNLIGFADGSKGRPNEIEARARVVDEAEWFLRAQLAEGQEQKAAKTAALLLGFDPTVDSFRRVIRTGRAAGAEELVATALEQARSALSKRELKALESASAD